MMNKNIKRTIALALALGIFSAVGPMKYNNVFTTAAYAFSSDADELDSLDLETSSGDSLKLYKNSSYSTKLSDDLDVGNTYYAKTSASKVVISGIDGADEDNVRIFKTGSTKAYEVGDNISISTNAKTVLKVRVYEDEYDSDETYSSSDYNQYTIIVENTDSTSTDDTADLLGIGLSYGNVTFNPDTTSYSINVPTDAESITVQAMPKDIDATVKINGTTVDSDDEYKKTIALDSTTNTITIKVSNDDDSKTYTLTVNKTLTAGSLGQGMNNGIGGQGMN